MLIRQYIQELLFQHECVTIPNFGAFLSHSVSATILPVNDSTGMKKKLALTAILKSNDGVLAHYIAQKENSSYEQALRRVEKEVIVWKQRLNTQHLTFTGIGEMRFNSFKKIEFLPFGKINFDLESFGLIPFQKHSLVSNELNSEPQIFTTMENENKEDLMFTPEKKNKDRSPILRFAAIGVIAIALASTLFYFGNEYATNEKAKSMELAQKKIKSNVQKATFNLGSLSKISLNLESNEAEATMAEQEANALSVPYYSVIAGSFRSMENATQKIAALIKEGYEAELTHETLLVCAELLMVDLLLQIEAFSLLGLASSMLVIKRLGIWKIDLALHLIQSSLRRILMVVWPFQQLELKHAFDPFVDWF